jgi:hypothetical protein
MVWLHQRRKKKGSRKKKIKREQEKRGKPVSLAGSGAMPV